jgi:hypothetical protein
MQSVVLLRRGMRVFHHAVDVIILSQLAGEFIEVAAAIGRLRKQNP